MVAATVIPALVAGNPVVVIDDAAGVEAPRLAIAAQSVTARHMAFLVRHTCGFVTVVLPALRCDALDLPACASGPWGGRLPVAAVSVDAANGLSTGISATDRARTARLLADPEAIVDNFTRPGHTVPVRVPEPRGMGLACLGDAVLALCAISGLERAAVCCELVRADGELMTASQAREFAQLHDLRVVGMQQIRLMWEAVGDLRVA